MDLAREAGENGQRGEQSTLTGVSDGMGLPKESYTDRWLFTSA
jgi:hypothetical protein